ncbi:hypothetical protein RQM47_04870 [Rubrivirga sp. S365]|uniref:EF-hand domain-containing protein n=1 Tax=Rubrivirga litoralis TaxID=3075598 RepID=A0ABU3BQ24_9BACT|nr:MULTISPECIES: hypothetical protein [unclassified Rubrivirga]MDT0631374.1 hypothetical protein [Rubrivirga sp. F394]MDT7855965.1 hypothetical protein [Rubrivirga sp. S365]
MRRFYLVLPFLLVGCASTATGTADDDFDAYDTDRDGFISDAEFGVGFGATPYYNDYDLDGDGRLDENEFGAGTADYGYDYGTFDADRDGFVTDDEYRTGVFGTFDTDRDGRLSSDEFGVGYGPYVRR